MRAIMVCVEFGDLLAITLPYNRHHFSEVMIVTTATDTETIAVAEANNAAVYCTDAFYRNNADFNKWLALEEGLDAFGRVGLLCIMDADVLWPIRIPADIYNLPVGILCSPFRRLWLDVTEPIPTEANWHRLPPVHDYEWAGYSQIFHAADPHLPAPPWHQTNWRHCGGADSFFQGLWPRSAKIRPSWSVLHLGMPGRNWCGRATQRTTGDTPEAAAGRIERLRSYLGQRGSAPRHNPYLAELLPTDG